MSCTTKELSVRFRFVLPAAFGLHFVNDAHTLRTAQVENSNLTQDWLRQEEETFRLQPGTCGAGVDRG